MLTKQGQHSRARRSSPHTSDAPICTAQNKEERKNLRAITQNSLFLFEMALISNKNPQDKSVRDLSPSFCFPDKRLVT